MTPLQRLRFAVDGREVDDTQAIIRDYGPFAMAAAWRRTQGNAMEAFDIVVEAFSRLFRNAHNLNEGRSLYCWLHEASGKLVPLVRRKPGIFFSSNPEAALPNRPNRWDVLAFSMGLDSQIDELSDQNKRRLLARYLSGRKVGSAAGNDASLAALRAGMARKTIMLTAPLLAAFLEGLSFPALPEPCVDEVAKSVLARNAPRLPNMTAPERELLLRASENTSTHFLFGVNECAVMLADEAARQRRRLSIFGVDNDATRIENISRLIAGQSGPGIEYAPMGPVNRWGFPLNGPTFDTWNRYPTAIERCGDLQSVDLVLLDGRFRRASLLQTLLNCTDGVRILFHDYPSAMHPDVEKWVEIVARAGSLVWFKRKPMSARQIEEVRRAYDKWWQDPR
jgi:DNA-directed RNA polymerase specialized sigma24 family protein